MRILLIRHAKALSREEWDEDDILRPLSEDGIKKAREFFAKLPKIYPIEVIITSKATRAMQTAKLLQEFYPNSKYFETARLNPGASPLRYEEVIEKFHCYENIALVGHEPDISYAVSHFSGCDLMQIHIKKASVTELVGEESYTLTGLIYPKMLKKLH
ncbi:phosphohistidine phosphatase [Nitratiruptor sp. YY08-26]|uniref:SixA phosphatase family protein n=1 Tax=unclassified Nitratiruptor TaxID=2624044 RepID=UPI001915DDF8|nr:MULTISPECIES: phosphoglycerate mutase family protein [unclassified Nitratiruptor]BCD61961.1 phosphohistidine phosphatase [Nitratiruptor sp. YY08-13]BCD65896.1 phosphohistidine phosphatase [Nitratiruptor sp. YY08-26]